MQDGQSALFVAADKGRVSVLRYLLKNYSVDVNVTDKEGDTPLISAVRGGYVRPVRLLLEAGASVHHKNEVSDDAFCL